MLWYTIDIRDRIKKQEEEIRKLSSIDKNKQIHAASAILFDLYYYVY
jgi:hypothetical protein